jgi:DNA-binding transcriptional LysR family regulator
MDMSASVELRHLRAFVAVASELNFTRAAARIHVAQQTLSDTIAQLESHLGSALLERTPRKVQLTPAGERFLEHAGRVLAAMDTAVSETRATGSTRRRVEVGVLTTSAINVRTSLLKRLADSGRYHVSTTAFGFLDPWCGLLAGTTDVAFTIEPIERPGISCVPLYSEPRVVLLSTAHPLLELDVIRRDDVMAYPAAALELESSDRHLAAWADFWQLQPGPAGRRPTPWVGRDLEGWLAAIAASDTVSTCPASFATLYQRPDLVYRPIEGVSDCSHLLAFRTSDADSDLIRHIIELLDDAPSVA